MRIAIPHWQGRVSPVFDVAENLILADIENSVCVGRRNICFEGLPDREKIRNLADMEVEILICGAISRQLELEVLARGIKVISQICGDVECVLTAFFDGRLRQKEFLMPGCCGRMRRRRRGGRNFRNW